MSAATLAYIVESALSVFGGDGDAGDALAGDKPAKRGKHPLNPTCMDCNWFSVEA